MKGEYYNNIDFTELKVAQVDSSVNFDWGNNAPHSAMNSDTFSVRWTGQIQPLYTENYTFHTNSDDGIRLWINGQKVIDNWTDHSLTENTGTISLTAGQKYEIKTEYYDKGGDAVIKLHWSSPSQTKQIVPKSQLYPSEIDTQAPSVPSGLTASAVSSTQINLRWNSSTDNAGIAGYKIYRNGTHIGTVTSGTSYSDGGLTANTTYVYTILAFDASGNSSAQSAPIVAATQQSSVINVALNKAASADSQEAANPAYKGNDGSTSTRWCAADGSFNHWWKADLGELYNITGSEITWELSGKVYKYKIEVSQDDRNWTLVLDRTNNTSTLQTQAEGFTANSARYVRITVTGFDSGCWASFSEFKIFGSVA
ncbi:MAG: PA14 domain-containing protein [Clostridia bacterium]|nr:PA14 domain-containing protein [Clostridia bacterium]